MLRYLMLCVVLLMTACGQKPASETYAESAVASTPAPMMAKGTAMDEARVSGAAEQSLTEVTEPSEINKPESQRYIAMRHQILVETSSEDLQTVFDATVARCETLKCQILSANINRQTQYGPPSASLSVRVPPRSLQIFLDGLAKSADLLQHHRASEDKTDAVIDAEARIKNLTELRDRLREMLAKRTGSLKDIIEVERELASTQSQLDTIHNVRKALAQETELVAVNIDFQAKQSITQTGFFAPVAQAWDNAGRMMMESVAAIISFLATSIPWLLIGIPLLILIRKFWRKLKAKFLG